VVVVALQTTVATAITITHNTAIMAIVGSHSNINMGSIMVIVAAVVSRM
jgi:hypothetical protein